MANILDEVMKEIPDKAKVGSICFEGANIVVYSKSASFFLDPSVAIKNIVDKIKKRVELRPDPSITMDLEKAEDIIKKIIPAEAKITNLNFDIQRSIVVIEVEKPGLAIGKAGEILKQIKKETLWVPTIQRTPSIKCKMIDNIRQVLFDTSDYRRKFLNKVGERIYGGWTKDKRSEWIRCSFLGAGRQVGRSCIFLQTPESKVLLDCGVNIASDREPYPFLEAPEFKIEELDAIVITHAHLDHSGFVPYLYKMGYKGPCYMTAPTRDIAALLALDYIGIAFKEAKKGLFSSSDVKEMVKHTIVLNFDEVSDITPDMRITLYNAGHTIGSAMVHLHIGNGLHNLLYTGDMKFARTKLLEPSVTKFPRLETVIMEATYGAKEDVLPARAKSEEELYDAINKTIEGKGKVLCPVLGVGRAQEVMLIIEDAMRNGKIPKVPVYVQGMVWDITAIHTTYPDFLNNNVKKAIFHRDQNPFLSEIFHRVGSMQEQKAVIAGEPCIILATSGMLTGGASVTYFRELAENPKNTLIFVCYQGHGSLGNRVQKGEKEIIIGGEKGSVKVNMKILTLPGLTGHSGRNQLTNFVYQLDPKPKKIILVHGESSKCLELASVIHKANRIETNAPRNLDALRIK